MSLGLDKHVVESFATAHDSACPQAPGEEPPSNTLRAACTFNHLRFSTAIMVIAVYFGSTIRLWILGTWLNATVKRSTEDLT